MTKTPVYVITDVPETETQRGKKAMRNFALAMTASFAATVAVIVAVDRINKKEDSED